MGFGLMDIDDGTIFHGSPPDLVELGLYQIDGAVKFSAR
jgi:hypothetical protein